MIVSGFVGAIRALFFGMIVVAVLLLFWAVVCVEVIQVYVKELEEIGVFAGLRRVSVLQHIRGAHLAVAVIRHPRNAAADPAHSQQQTQPPWNELSPPVP